MSATRLKAVIKREGIGFARGALPERNPKKRPGSLARKRQWHHSLGCHFANLFGTTFCALIWHNRPTVPTQWTYTSVAA
jgi:hypothetical protein